jgi:hypothetical protein
MIKTVRIASILTALLVVIIVALPVVLGANNSGAKNKKSYDVQSVVERFKKNRGERAKKDTDQKPPLVKEAEDFALYLNPPKPEPKAEIVKPPAPRKTAALPPVQSVSRTAKFNLIATCVHESNPALSVALIDAPGGDRRWVRPSDVVGHLIIKEIKEGSVIINDGARTYPLDMVARPVETSLVVGKSTTGASKLPTDSSPVLTNGIGFEREALIEERISAAKRSDESVRNQQSSEPVISAEEQEIFDKFIEELDGILAGPFEDEASREKSFMETDALMEKYFSELENMRIGGKEAQKLDDLGKKLDSEKKDPNQPKVNKAPASPRRRPPVLR